MAIQYEDDMSAPPMGPDQVECGLEVSLVELLRDRAEPMAAFDIQDSGQHPNVTGGDDGYGCLFSHRSPHGSQGRNLIEDPRVQK